MFQGLKIGSSGMHTAQKVLDNVADRIANSNTHGYKAVRVDFNELLLNEMGENQVTLSPNGAGSAIAAGSRAGFSKVDFTQGGLVTSEYLFHLALEGRGFFGVYEEDGTRVLTRDGGFQRNENHSLTDAKGRLLDLDAWIPLESWPENQAMVISTDGWVRSTGQDGQELVLGRIPIYLPETEAHLLSLGEGRYLVPEGVPLYNSMTHPEMTYGVLRSHTLETSNADIATSMTQMILTQRSYQMNAKSVTTADEMLEVINTIV